MKAPRFTSHCPRGYDKSYMSTQLSRRQLAASLVAAAPALAQNPAPAPPPDLAAKARDILQRNGERLSQFDVPIATEPSFIFKP